MSALAGGDIDSREYVCVYIIDEASYSSRTVGESLSGEGPKHGHGHQRSGSRLQKEGQEKEVFEHGKLLKTNDLGEIVATVPQRRQDSIVPVLVNGHTENRELCYLPGGIGNLRVR